MPGEEGNDATERQERRERDAHLPGPRAVAGDEDERRDKSRKHAEHQRDRDRPAEHHSEQQSQLHVAHSHPLRVREGGREEKTRDAEPRDEPLDPRVQSRLGQEDDDRGRDDHTVRDDPVLQVSRRDGDERGAEEARDQGVEGQAELPDAAGDE